MSAVHIPCGTGASTCAAQARTLLPIALMATLHVDPTLPAIAPEQSLTGWHHELCIELLGDGAARIWARAVEAGSFKAAELRRAVLFRRLDMRFDDLAGCIDALRTEMDHLVDSARRVQPGQDNLFATVEYDRQAWEQVEQGIDRWARRPK